MVWLSAPGLVLRWAQALLLGQVLRLCFPMVQMRRRKAQ